MKIRSGFVSNSSSSSFVLMTTKENHEVAKAALTKGEQKVIELDPSGARFFYVVIPLAPPDGSTRGYSNSPPSGTHETGLSI